RNSQPDCAESSGPAHPATRVLSAGPDTCALSGSIPPAPAGALHPPAGKFQPLVVLDEQCIPAPTVQNGASSVQSWHPQINQCCIQMRPPFHCWSRPPPMSNQIGQCFAQAGPLPEQDRQAASLLPVRLMQARQGSHREANWFSAG